MRAASRAIWLLRAVPAVPEQLDDHRVSREAAVDAHEAVLGSRQHLLRLRPGQPGPPQSSRKRRSSQLCPPRLASHPSITASSFGMP